MADLPDFRTDNGVVFVGNTIEGGDPDTFMRLFPGAHLLNGDERAAELARMDQRIEEAKGSGDYIGGEG